MSRAYVLVSPCKDESQHIERTLTSVLNQTEPPALWVIVDDGSSDDSAEIVERYMADMPYLRLVRRTSGDRAVGGGVVRAFNQGLDDVDVPYDYICKLDVDLDLPKAYFANLMDRMEQNANLGSCSGKPYYNDPKTGELLPEVVGEENAIGAAKFFRAAAFEDIGGFETDVGWDGYDGHLARWHGWDCRLWDDEDIRFLHLRPMGSSHQNIGTGRIRHGRGQYLIGTHPIYFLISTAFRAVRQRPYFSGAYYQAVGFFRAMREKEDRFGSADIIRFIRAYQFSALRKGKLAAAEEAAAKRRQALGINRAAL